MSDVQSSMPPAQGFGMLGPIESPDHHDLYVDAQRVPFLKAYQQGASWHLSLDDRFGMADVSEEEMRRWVPFIADCMAIAAGFTSFDRPNPSNPFALRATLLQQYQAD